MGSRIRFALMVNERYLDIAVEEVVLIFTSYARDLELSK